MDSLVEVQYFDTAKEETLNRTNYERKKKRDQTFVYVEIKYSIFSTF